MSYNLETILGSCSITSGGVDTTQGFDSELFPFPSSVNDKELLNMLEKSIADNSNLEWDGKVHLSYSYLGLDGKVVRVVYSQSYDGSELVGGNSSQV